MDVPTLYRTAHGGKLHRLECIHLADTDPATLVPEGPGDREALQICATCQAVLGGAERHLYATFDEALEALPIPLDNRARCRELAATVDHTDVWIPNSRAYIALGNHRGVVAYFNVGYADMQPPGGAPWREEFPNFASSSASSANTYRARVVEKSCPVHHITLPGSGICDDCDG